MHELSQKKIGPIDFSRFQWIIQKFVHLEGLTFFLPSWALQHPLGPENPSQTIVLADSGGGN